MAKMNIPDPEWSYKIDAEEIGQKPQSFFLSADKEICKDLSRRLNVKSIKSLEAKLDVRLETAGRYYVSGYLKANVVQVCVVTLEPIENWIEEPFEAWFADRDKTLSFSEAKKQRETQKGHVEVEATDESKDPESLKNGYIEAGELVTQYLSLAINPYPHTQGAEHEIGDDVLKQREPSDLRKNPFEALKNWKKRT